MDTFKKGDVVRLKSGSPEMTVEDITADGKLACVWYDKDKKEILERKFSYECLDLAEPVKRKR